MRRLPRRDRQPILRLLLLVALLGAGAAGVEGCAGRGGKGQAVSPALKPRPVTGGVLFQYRAAGATSVAIVGDFNTWSPNEDLLSDDDRDGVWTLVFPLPPGTYQYKYVIDGDHWVEDPANPDRVPDGFGGTNSVMEVR